MTQCCIPFRDPNTVRILSIDGGGEKNYMSLYFLEKFIAQWGIGSSAPISDQFDVICGTGFGGILALALAAGNTPASLNTLFTTSATSIYSDGGGRADINDKIADLVADPQAYFYDSGVSTAFGSGFLKAYLDTLFGFGTLQSLKTNVVIPTYETVSGKYVLCSNMDYPNFDGQKETIANVALATSLNNPYFPPLVIASTIPGKLDGTYSGGEIYQNNSAAFGRAAGQILKTKRRCCLLSLGTGYGGTTGFSGADSLTGTNAVIANAYKQYNLSYDGGSEGVDEALFLESEYGDTVGNLLHYYRFNPLLNTAFDTEQDNTDGGILTYYQTTVDNYYNTDIQNISTFLRHLIA